MPDDVIQPVTDMDAYDRALLESGDFVFEDDPPEGEDAPTELTTLKDPAVE